MTENEEWRELCAFFRRSRYDVIQVWEEVKWGRAWTFPACDVHAAERVGRQMRRVHGTEVKLRHAHKAHLRIGTGKKIDAVIVTEMPSMEQVVLALDTARPLQLHRKVLDETILALRTAAGMNAVFDTQKNIIIA